MSEILQPQEIVKLYSEYTIKPELSEDILEHFGIKGMRWGHRKDESRKGTFSRRQVRKAERVKKRIARDKQKAALNKNKKKDKYENKQQAIDARDLKYINKHKSEYSTNEINNLLNRINTEQRLSQMAKDQKRSRRIFKKITSNPVFKMAAIASLSALSYATVNYIVNKDNRSKKNYAKDLAVGAFSGGISAAPIPGPIKNDAQRLTNALYNKNNKKKKG